MANDSAGYISPPLPQHLVCPALVFKQIVRRVDGDAFFSIMEGRRAPYPAPSQSAAHKVAIPELPRARSERRQRAARACKKCRDRKRKCDGEQPMCSQCKNSNEECVYDDTKRVREQRQLEHLPKVIEDHERLLDNIITGVDESTADWIRTEASVGFTTPILLGCSDLC